MNTNTELTSEEEEDEYINSTLEENHKAAEANYEDAEEEHDKAFDALEACDPKDEKKQEKLSVQLDWAAEAMEEMYGKMDNAYREQELDERKVLGILTDEEKDEMYTLECWRPQYEMEQGVTL